MSKIKVKTNLTKEILISLDLNENEAELYLKLLDIGKAKAQEIVRKVKFTRTMLYHILKSLEEKDLIVSKKENWKTTYHPLDPEKLYNLLHKKESQFSKEKESIRKIIPILKREYSLKSRKPNIKTYEGLLEYQRLLNEIVESKPEIIYSIENLENKKAGLELNEAFENKRIFNKIKKMTFFKESKKSLENLKKIKYNDYTHYFSLKNKEFDIKNEMMLFDDKVSYTQFTEGKEPYSILIEDKFFYEMQKCLLLNLKDTSINQTLYYTKK